jgi:hypothetical protein
MIRFVLPAYVPLLFCGMACAQTPAVAPPVEPDKHIFGILPNFRTAPDTGEYHPITYGDQMIGNVMTEGVMPSPLHEDPRYFRRIHGSIPVRATYAVSRTLVTRTHENTRRFNFSEFIGNGITAEIGNAYYPARRSLGGTARRFGTQLTSGAISNCLKEFRPDINT